MYAYVNLCSACDKKNWREVKRLVEAGAPVNNEGYYKDHGDGYAESVNTPLMRAVMKDAGMDILQLLLDAGSYIDAHGNRGYTALMCAAEEKTLDVHGASSPCSWS